MLLNPTTEDMVKAAILGDREAIEKLLLVKGKQILYTAMKLLPNEEDAKDAAQESMLYIYQHITELKNPLAIDAWMYRVVSHTCVSLIRKAKKKTDAMSSSLLLDETEFNRPELRMEFLPDDYMEDIEKREALLKIVDELPPVPRQCTLLYYYGGLSYKEIAAVMDINTKQVDYNLFRAKNLIRKALEKDEETKRLLIYVLVPFPLLTWLFHQDADLHIPSDTVRELVTNTISSAEDDNCDEPDKSGKGAPGARRRFIAVACLLLILAFIIWSLPDSRRDPMNSGFNNVYEEPSPLESGTEPKNDEGLDEPIPDPDNFGVVGNISIRPPESEEENIDERDPHP